MLRSETLFGKRETSTPNTPFGGAGITPPGSAATSRSTQPISGTPPSASVSPSTTSSSNNSSTNEIGSKLIVGPNIKLKGVEINDCDTLVVEGMVEATMDSRVIQIAERGAFVGSAEIDVAEIRGDFKGKLTVRQKLFIYSTGTVSGEIRYGKLVVEEGGQISGNVQVNGSQGQLDEVNTDKPLKTVTV